jgi:P27 family predicted phage terminase small subunit
MSSPKEKVSGLGKLESLKKQAAPPPSPKPSNTTTSASKTSDIKPIFQLDKEGEELFHEVVQYLASNSLIESVDAITVTMLAKSLALYITIAREIHEYDDVVQVFQNGTSNVSGAFTALSKAQDQVLKLSAKLGLSPMDRSRILGAAANAQNAKDKSIEGDEIDALMK